MATVIGLRELGALARTPLAGVVSPFDGSPYVLLRLERSAAGQVGEADPAMVRWLRRQPCPVIAIAEAGAHEDLQRACDVVVTEPADLEAVLRNVRASPLAAMMLVQVLRVTEQLPVEQALVVESLAFATLQCGPEFRRWLDGRPPPRATHEVSAGPPVVVERHGPDLAQ